MVSHGPSTSHEKTKLTSALEGAYGRFNTTEVLHSSTDIIKEHLLSHIACINPNLAKEMMQSGTEGNVLKIIGRVDKIAGTAASANDECIKHVFRA